MGEGTMETADRLDRDARPRQAILPVQDPAFAVLAAQQFIRLSEIKVSDLSSYLYSWHLF